MRYISHLWRLFCCSSRVQEQDIRYTFISHLSSHHCLKNEICYSFIPLVLPHDGLKNKVYYTHSLLKKNQLVCLCPSTDKIWETWRSIWGDLQLSQVKNAFQDSINEFIIRKLNPLVVVYLRFISVLLHV